MRMRGRKVLTLSIALVIIVLLCIGYFSNGNKEHGDGDDDPYIIHLPQEQAETLQPPPERARAQSPQLELELRAGSLLNLSNFMYLIPNDLCHAYNKELLGVLIVTSYAGHDAERAAHRQAITQAKLTEMGFKRVFLLAALPAREKFVTQMQLNEEQKRYGDLLQGNFNEAYRNLSYKHIMGLNWAATHCRQAKFIVKLDDDIIYDVFHLRRYLESLEVKQSTLSLSSALLAGYVLEAMPPIRNSASKWYVTRHEYADAMYPAYLSGWLYITNPATAARLVAVAQRLPIFWIDDTWVTGVLRSHLGIPMQRCNDWYSANAEFLDCCVRDLQQFSYECEYFIGPNGGESKLLIEFLHNVEKCYFDECVKRPADKSLKRTCVGVAKSQLPAHGAAQVQPVRLR